MNLVCSILRTSNTGLLGGLGVFPPENFLNFKCSEIASSAIRKLTLHVK